MGFKKQSHHALKLKLMHSLLFGKMTSPKLTSWEALGVALDSTPEVKVKVAQSCPTLCDLTKYRVHGILQARILEWVAYP